MCFPEHTHPAADPLIFREKLFNQTEPLLSVLEVVPLTLLTLDAWDFVRTTRGHCYICDKPVAVPHKWTFYFLMAVGFWNFVGAGIFGFLINLPIVSYYETGTLLTPNHAHAAMMGVFGMLAIALMVFVLRQTTTEERWPSIEKYIRVAFWGTNIGLAMMVVMSLFPAAYCRSGMWPSTVIGMPARLATSAARART